MVCLVLLFDQTHHVICFLTGSTLFSKNNFKRGLFKSQILSAVENKQAYIPATK